MIKADWRDNSMRVERKKKGQKKEDEKRKKGALDSYSLPYVSYLC